MKKKNKKNCTFFWIFQIYTTKFQLFVCIYFGTLYFLQHVMESCHFPILDTAILKQNRDFLLSPQYFFYVVGYYIFRTLPGILYLYFGFGYIAAQHFRHR